MRRLVLNLAVPLIVLVLVLSSVAFLPVTGQTTGTIISKLDRLAEMLENEHPSLENKVNAVIHQIEAEAFDGALNKLENDVKKSIEAQVEDPQEAIDLINEIIKDIEDLLHPKPPGPDFEISADPMSLEVVQGNSNKTTITITSVNNFSQEVALTNSTTATGVALSLSSARLTPAPNGTITSNLTVTAASDAALGEYTIAVTASSAGFEPKLLTIELKITAQTPQLDKTPPTINSVLRTPETPAYNETVTIEANVFDEGGSGLKQVTLNYSGGSTWTLIDMALSQGLYRANIPSFPFDTTVEYRVVASDNNDNLASSVLFSYQVVDPYPPLLRIDTPTQGSYLSGIVTITVFMKDQDSGGESGFRSAELSINDTIVKSWLPPAPSAPDTYDWDTTASGTDGVHIVKLIVLDEAGNVAERSLTVTVDNTEPTASIEEPDEDSYLHLDTIIKITGSDANFDKMELRIDTELVQTYLETGTKELVWSTQSDSDGAHSITLTVYDKAGNTKQVLVNVTVDNTAPSIGTPTWSPKEPAANAEIQINVTVTEPISGSGVDKVNLLFKNSTLDTWLTVPMEHKDGNWTATLTSQSDTKITFYIEALDKIGNRAETVERFELSVAGPVGLPLSWILAAIAIILIALVIGIYLLGRREKKRPLVPSTTAPATTK